MSYVCNKCEYDSDIGSEADNHEEETGHTLTWEEIEPCCDYFESCERVEDYDQDGCCNCFGGYDHTEINKMCQPCQERYYP